ncbi:hypothetical protein [Bacillus cereus]|uniref:hypothetical protein n=1 Tax=Bacillus cereus TaxID=1396 RepID=UPI0009444FD8|nr:hypothetical protein [Bacillus cereus]
MTHEKQMKLLTKAQENNDELIEISYKLMEIAKKREDEATYNQVSDDVKFLIQLKEKFTNEQMRLEK